jgi:hypothetical protein
MASALRKDIDALKKEFSKSADPQSPQTLAVLEICDRLAARQEEQDALLKKLNGENKIHRKLGGPGSRLKRPLGDRPLGHPTARK